MGTLHLPFSFDRYALVATFSGSEPRAGPRSARGETAWRLLDAGSKVTLEVRVPGTVSARVLQFDNGRYQGFRDGVRRFPGRDCPEHGLFLEACAARLSDPEDVRTRLAGAAGRVLRDVLSRSTGEQRPSTP